MSGSPDQSEYDPDLPAEEGGAPDDGYEEEAPDNLQEMGQIVGNVPVPLVVELGRVECSARDVMYLRIGQILELRRSPYEPLDLVVNGRTLGKGELVEIEGQLGIRIVEMLK